MITIHTKSTGPFFQMGARPIDEAAAELVAAITREGEAKVESQLYPGHGVLTGEYKRSVIHQLRKGSLHGVITDDLSVKGKVLEGGRYYGSGRRFKGYHQFRKATAHLRKIAREVAGKKYAKAIKRLT